MAEVQTGAEISSLWNQKLCRLRLRPLVFVLVNNIESSVVAAALRGLCRPVELPVGVTNTDAPAQQVAVGSSTGTTVEISAEYDSNTSIRTESLSVVTEFGLEELEADSHLEQPDVITHGVEVEVGVGNKKVRVWDLGRLEQDRLQDIVSLEQIGEDEWVEREDVPAIWRLTNKLPQNNGLVLEQ